MLKRLLLLFFILPVVTSAAAAPETDASASILVLGDSLSAGHGIPLEQGWVTLLEQRLAEYAASAGYRYEVINASISGETTRGARSRINAIITRHQPDVAIVELGGNDGLRGIAPREMRQNLAAIIERLQQQGARVLLVPMKMPPNYGPAFTQKFEAVYGTLAKQYDVVLSRFILEDIAQHPELMQDDGIHPTAAAQSKMLANIWPALKPILPASAEAQTQQAQSL